MPMQQPGDESLHGIVMTKTGTIYIKDLYKIIINRDASLELYSKHAIDGSKRYIVIERHMVLEFWTTGDWPYDGAEVYVVRNSFQR